MRQMTRRLTWKESIAVAMTEAELSENVRQLASGLHYLTYHTWRSDHSAAGYPDWTLVKQGRLIFVELKRQRGKTSKYQEQWLGALRECPLIEVYEWHPSDWIDGTIQQVLAGTPSPLA